MSADIKGNGESADGKKPFEVTDNFKGEINSAPMESIILIALIGYIISESRTKLSFLNYNVTLNIKYQLNVTKYRRIIYYY